MKTSWLAAAGVILALAVWMASGLIRDDRDAADTGGTGGTAPAAGPAPMRVEIVRAELRSERRTLTLRGELAAARMVELRAQTAGTVARIAVARGDRVDRGQPLVRLDAGTREPALEAARAQFASARAEREAAESLGRSGLQSRLRAEQARAAASLAQAEVHRLERDLADTMIAAPFAGLVEALPVELGALIERGEPVATLVDDSAFEVTARAAQQVAAELRPGQEVEVRLITGETLAGRVNWIASVADPATRSFDVEARIDNPGTALAAGTSATLVIPVEEVEALFVSPSTLALGESGELGVKTLDAEDRVIFQPVTLLRTSLDGAWVTGVAAGSRVVTLGQGFVSAGERVIATEVPGDPEPPSLGPGLGSGLGPGLGPGLGAANETDAR